MTSIAKDAHDPADDEPWASLAEAFDERPKRAETKIPLDAAHECPCCGGKGFIRVSHEPRYVRKKG